MYSIKELSDECERTGHCIRHKRRKIRRYSDDNDNDYEERDIIRNILG